MRAHAAATSASSPRPPGGARFVLTLPVLDDGDEPGGEDGARDAGDPGEAPALLAAALLAVAVRCRRVCHPDPGLAQHDPDVEGPVLPVDPHPPTTTTTQPNARVTGAGEGVLPRRRQTSCVEAPRVVASPAPLPPSSPSLLVGPDASGDGQRHHHRHPEQRRGARRATTAGQLVTVNFNSAFGEITGTDTELAVGQIVATVANENGLGTGRGLRDRGRTHQRPDRQRLARCAGRSTCSSSSARPDRRGSGRWPTGRADGVSRRPRRRRATATRGAPDHRCSRS